MTSMACRPTVWGFGIDNLHVRPWKDGTRFLSFGCLCSWDPISLGGKASQGILGCPAASQPSIYTDARSTPPPIKSPQSKKCLQFIAALFKIAKGWKQPKCPLTDDWIKMI